MKKLILILSTIFIITLCLTAYGKPNTLTFEEAIDSISHFELNEMLDNTENYEQKFKLSSNLSGAGNNIQTSFSVNSKHNKKDSEGESKISLKINVSGSGNEHITLNGNAIIKYLPNSIYFKLNTLNINGLENSMDDLSSSLSGVINKWFSFELTKEMLESMDGKLPEDFDFNKLYNEEDLQKFKNNIKKTIKNEGSIIYKGIYSEFSGCNARKFSIDKKKVFEATTEYIKGFVPEEKMDDYMKSIEEINIDEIFENFPIKNFKGYIVITPKNTVQAVIENLDIVNDYSTTKIYGTFGKEKYELVVKQDEKDALLFSAKLDKNHYNVILKSSGQRILKGTITPKKSKGKFDIRFNLSINFKLDEKTNIPLNGGWSWKEISKFNVKVPANSQNLLEDIMKNTDGNFDVSSLQLLMGRINNQSLSVPFIAGGILAAGLTPRMQSAQGRARDVSRKAALSQIQSAIVTSYYDKGEWPGINSGASKGIPTNKIKKELMQAGMSSVPKDPVDSNANYGLGENYKTQKTAGEYLYLVTKRNGIQNGGFVLMAKTEVEGGSNRVVCNNGNGLEKGYITNNTDIANISTCTNITKGSTCGINEGNCTYTDDSELRYIIMY